MGVGVGLGVGVGVVLGVGAAVGVGLGAEDTAGEGAALGLADAGAGVGVEKSAPILNRGEVAMKTSRIASTIATSVTRMINTLLLMVPPKRSGGADGVSACCALR